VNDAATAAEGLGPYGWGIIIFVLGLIAWRAIASKKRTGTLTGGFFGGGDGPPTNKH
jgi:hypothetical protein